MFKQIILSSLFLTSLYATQNHQQASVGWIDGNCLAIYNDSLEKGRLISVLDYKNKIIQVKILKTVTNSEECDALFEERKSVNQNNNQKFYLLNTSNELVMGIGMLKEKWYTKLDKLSFTHCSSLEGIHYKLQEKKSKKLLWNGYYYLGYEMESTCD